MEERCKKAAVFSAETLFSQSAEVPVDIEFNLPDYCPEISRILKCRAVPRVASKSAENRTVTVDGGVSVTVIYADREEGINSYEYQYPFSKSFDAGEDIGSGLVSATAKCEYINCRAVTERKVDIHGALRLGVAVESRRRREIVSDIDSGDIKLRKETVAATESSGEAEKYILLEEEIEVGAGEPDIGCLIRYDAAASADECKLLAGKAIVKGSVAVNLIYRGEDGEIQPLSATVPFSALLEIEGASEDLKCTAKAYIAYLEVKPKADSSGQARAFSLDGKINITVKTLRETEIGIITDAYSCKYEAKISGGEVAINKLVSDLNDTFSTKAQLDFSPDSISRVRDIWCDIKEENAVAQGDCLKVYGTANVGLIAETGDGTVRYFEKPIEYEYTYKLPAVCGDITANMSVTVREINYTLPNENTMEIRVQMAVNGAVYDTRKLSLVSDVAVDESKPISNDTRHSLTVYFAEPGESLWDISRRYLADAEKVGEINGIKDDRIEKRQMIMLPGN